MACGTRYTIAQMQSILRQAGCPETLIVALAAIGMAESSGCSDIVGTIAKGREVSVGLWQINTLVHKNYTPEQLTNPAINAREAVRLVKTSTGLRHWGAYTDGRYRKHLAESQQIYNGGNVPVNLPTPTKPTKPTTQVVPVSNVTPDNSTVSTAAISTGAIGLGLLLLFLVMD